MQADIQGILDTGEKIIWSGQPDVQAIKKTRHIDTGLFSKTGGLAGVILLIAFIWVMSNSTIVWNTSPYMKWVWVTVIASGIWIAYSRLYANRKKLQQWATALAYVITDKRILILKEGKIDQLFTLSDVLQTQFSERKGAPGFNDLIWEKQIIDHGTSGRGVRYVSPLEWEQAETGFKALADAESVKQILDNWINAQQQIAQGLDDAFIDKQSGDLTDPITEDISKESSLVQYVSPKFGFSVDFPATWEITSRYRRIAFGKWGIEKEPVWSTPDKKPKWNVIRGQNDINTHVEIQVQKIAAFNNPDSLKSSAASLLGAGEIVDSNSDIKINGIPGFYVTRHCGSKSSFLPSQIQELVSFWYMRQYILHDGQYQYYIEAMWPADDSGQQAICEAIVATLLPS